MVGCNSHNRTWRLWDSTDEETRITRSAEASFREKSSRDMELLQEERPRLPVLIDDVYPTATTEQGEEADTGTPEVRSARNHSHDESNTATLPTAEADDGQAIMSNPQEVPSQTVEYHAEVSSL